MEFSDGTDARMVKETLDVKTAISNKKTCFTPWVRQLVSVCPRSDFAREFENFETERIAGLDLGAPARPLLRSCRVRVLSGFFLPTGGIKLPPTGSDKPVRFDWLSVKIDQIQNPN